MRWDDEAYVRLYKRETPEWCLLSWQARALFYELLKRVDMAGLLMVGKAGLRGLAGLVRMPPDVVHDALHGDDGLLADGCVVTVEGGYLIPNYVEAQQAKQSDRVRKAEQRARDRAAKLDGAQARTGHAESHDVTSGHAEDRKPDNVGQVVTMRDTESRPVTESHDVSRGVTRGHSEQSLAEQSTSTAVSPEGSRGSAEPVTPVGASGDGGGGRASTIPGFAPPDPLLTPAAVLAELRRHPQLAHVVDGARHAPQTLVTLASANGVTLAQVVECIGYVASVAPDGEAVASTLGRLRGAVTKVHKRAADQRRREHEAPHHGAEAPPRPKLPPGTGRDPGPMPLPPKAGPVEPSSNPVLRALGVDPVPLRRPARTSAPSASPASAGAKAGAPTAVGDLLGGFVRGPSGEA